MENVNLSITLQFSQDDFDMAYLLLKQLLGENVPPKEFFITGPNTVVNYTQLVEDPAESPMICQAMMAGKLSFALAEKAVDELKVTKSKIITDLNS